MKFTDIFKSKITSSKTDDYSLETLLMKAVTEPAYRAEFYKRLLTDNLIIVPLEIIPLGRELPDSKLTGSKLMFKKGDQVRIYTFPDGQIPVFTSDQKIHEKGITKEKVNVLELKGEYLFEMTKGARFILNPYSDYAKELLPDEIERLLNGTILTNRTGKIFINKATQVQVCQPKDYPTEMINSLKVLFANKPNIKAAYLGWIFDPASGEPAHYILGFDVDGETQSLFQETGFTIQQYLGRGEFADYIQTNTDSELAQYLKSTKPFYEK
jgi:hypothetical protein